MADDTIFGIAFWGVLSVAGSIIAMLFLVVAIAKLVKW